MNKKISTKLGVIIIIMITVVAGVFVWNHENNRNVNDNQEKSQLNNVSETKPKQSSDAKTEVSFCNKKYTTEKIILNDVDVIKRIASLSQSDKFKICENIINNSTGTSLSAKINKQQSGDADYKEGVYFLNISILEFKIDSKTNNIYIIGAFDGKLTFIGKLK